MKLKVIVFLILSSKAYSQGASVINCKGPDCYSLINVLSPSSFKNGSLFLKGYDITDKFRPICYLNISGKINRDSGYVVSIAFVCSTSDLEIGLTVGSVDLLDEKIISSINYRQAPLDKNEVEKNGKVVLKASFVAFSDLSQLVISIRKTAILNEEISLEIKDVSVECDVANKDSNLVNNPGFEGQYGLFYYGETAYHFNNYVSHWNNSLSNSKNIDGELEIIEKRERRKYLNKKKKPSTRDFELNILNYGSDFQFGTPDFFYDHSSYFKAHSGKACVGINLIGMDDQGQIARGREFVRGELKKCLKKGQKYKVSFYYKFTRLFWECSRMSNCLGVLVSETDMIRVAYKQDSVKLFKTSSMLVTDSLNKSNGWTQASFIYEATGNERYIYIGDFREKNLVVEGISRDLCSYYLLDDVSVVEIP